MKKFCIVVDVRVDGKAKLISPNGDFKYIAKPKKKPYKLGELVDVDIEKDEVSPTYNELESGEVTVEGNTLIISDVQAEYKSSDGCKFYETKEFGRVKCFDRNVANGSKFLINITLLKEDENVGKYTSYVWGGEKSKSIQNQMANLQIGNNKMNVIGLIACLKEENSYFVWTKESYPGNDGVLIAYPDDKVIRVGGWVNMTFSKEEYDLYFPSKPNATTPKFTCVIYENIEPVLKTSQTTKNSVQITFDEFIFPVGYQPGSYTYHEKIGYISDAWNLGPTIAGRYKITIKRSKPDMKPNAKPTVWYISKTESIDENPVKKTPQTVDIIEVGLITTVITNDSNNTGKSPRDPFTVFVWMLKKHKSAIFHTDRKFSIGDFIQGHFTHSNDNWICIKFVKFCAPEFEVRLYQNNVQPMIMIRDARLPPLSKNRKWAETYHESFGTIIDNRSMLTSRNWINGINISIRHIKFDPKMYPKGTWVVTEVHD